MLKCRFIKVLFVGGLLLSSCSGNVGDKGYVYDKTIEMTQGSVVGNLSESQWELDLKSDSFEKKTDLSMKVVKVAESELLSEFSFLSNPVELSVKDEKSVRLSTPATLRVQIPKEYTGPLSSVFMAYYTDEGWEYFTPDYVDLSSNVATSTVTHFSKYGFGVLSNEKQIDAYAKKVAAINWVKNNDHADLIEATKNQYDDMLLNMGVESEKDRNQFVADMISFLENGAGVTGDASPMDALVQMANAASQGAEGKAAFAEKFVEFSAKAMEYSMQADPGAYADKFSNVLNLGKIAIAIRDGEDEDALKGLAGLLKTAVPTAQIVETVLVHAVNKAQKSIEYWTAQELEKAYQAYIGNGKGKYGFADSSDFDLIFTTLGGGQRMNEIYLVNKWCEARKIDCDQMGQATKDKIVKDAYEALRAHFDLRKVKDPEIKQLELDEKALIEAMIKEGLMDPNLYKESWGDGNRFNATARLDQLYKVKKIVMGFIDPEVAKTLSPAQIAKIMGQWFFHTKDNNRRGFYDYLKALGYLRKVENDAQFAWVFKESVVYDGKKGIENTNKGGVYSASGEVKPGSFTYTWTYLGDGDTYYDPDLLTGEGATIVGTNSEPPKIIKGDEVVSLSLSISISKHMLSYYSANGYISADIDEFDMEPVYTTNRYEDFVNKDKRSTFKVDTYSTVQVYSNGDTVTARMPVGDKPNEKGEFDKIAIRVVFSQGMGVNYIYEWRPVN